MNDLTGQRFGKLTVLEFDHRGIEYGQARNFWKCQCDCGNITIISQHKLVTNGKKSCGCLHAEVMHKIKTVHGERHTKLYNTWVNMKNRCLNKNVACYERYGGKGIQVCDEWLEYKNFSEWAHASGYQEGLTIERIDPTGDYCPNNCEWISFVENCRRAGQKDCWGKNLETGEYVEFHGIKDFADSRGLSNKAIDRVLHNKAKTHKNWTFGYL